MSRRTLVAVAAAVAVVVLAACTPRPTPSTIDVLGDSILVQSVNNRYPAWRSAGVGLPNDLDLVGDAYPGFRFEDVQAGESARVNHATTPRPSILVIALGANNASPLESGDGWTDADLKAFVKLLGTPHPSACVVVSLPAASPAAAPAVRTEFAKMRPAMEAAARRRTNTVVVDWADTVDEHPEYLSALDGVHLAYDHANPGDSANAEAADAYAAHLWAGVAQCPGRST